MTQQALDFTAPRSKPTLAERFDAFHSAHPEVYAMLRRLALEAVAAGRTRLGMRELYEVARWTLRIERTGEYKLNNDLAPVYARRLMADVPQLAGAFETRTRSR